MEKDIFNFEDFLNGNKESKLENIARGFNPFP